MLEIKCQFSFTSDSQFEDLKKQNIYVVQNLEYVKNNEYIKTVKNYG